ncbi:hypothetical protein CAAN1_19S02388 [[Candida] anglica]|uniref:Putative 5'-nucleotidase C-terminal domain-containing protein n=1 Tax=[Candida] anglica TaxID=148631 RepID=A0ABP0E5C9_9ASCO
METQPLIATEEPVERKPTPFKHRLVGLIAGLAGALLLFQFFFFPGPRERVHYDLSIRDLTWGDVNFLQTTDTHGWYSGHINQRQYHANWGDFISFASRLREIARANNQDILLVDTGDRHDGNGLSDVTVPNGSKSLPIFIQQEYDLITLGNHELYEFENSRQEYELVAAHFGSKYVCSNVEYKLPNGTFVPIGNKYRYFTTENKKVRVLALSFLFDFTRFNDGTRVTPIRDSIEQEWFSDTLKQFQPEDVDLLVVFGHIPISHKWSELYLLHTRLRESYPNTKIQYFGAHSHIRDFSVFDENSVGLQSGRFCETVGWASVKLNGKAAPSDSLIDAAKESFSRSYIDFNLQSFLHHSRVDSLDDFHTERGLNVSKQIVDTRKSLKLDDEIGKVENNYYLDYVPINHPKSIFELLTKKVLPTLNSTKSEQVSSAGRIIIINTGSIRYDLYKGSYTLDSQYIVSPFENDWVKLSLPRKVALKIASKLNDVQYITTDSQQSFESLKPPHHWNQPDHFFTQMTDGDKFEVEQEQEKNDYFNIKKQLPKGYVTVDDFGHDGDDTPHRPVVNYPIPNVVESVELNPHLKSDHDVIDVVFYSFITPNIIWALKELDFTRDVTKDVEFYSDEYLGLLLNSYIENFGA